MAWEAIRKAYGSKLYIEGFFSSLYVVQIDLLGDIELELQENLEITSHNTMNLDFTWSFYFINIW